MQLFNAVFSGETVVESCSFPGLTGFTGFTGFTGLTGLGGAVGGASVVMLPTSAVVWGWTWVVKCWHDMVGVVTVSLHTVDIRC